MLESIMLGDRSRDLFGYLGTALMADAAYSFCAACLEYMINVFCDGINDRSCRFLACDGVYIHLFQTDMAPNLDVSQPHTRRSACTRTPPKRKSAQPLNEKCFAVSTHARRELCNLVNAYRAPTDTTCLVSSG